MVIMKEEHKLRTDSDGGNIIRLPLVLLISRTYDTLYIYVQPRTTNDVRDDKNSFMEDVCEVVADDVIATIGLIISAVFIYKGAKRAASSQDNDSFCSRFRNKFLTFVIGILVSICTLSCKYYF